MACACKSKNRKQWEVVASSGRVVYTTTAEHTARAVSKRYPDSHVREKAKAAT